MDIQTLAYQISQERQAQGLPPDPTADWLQAEAELQNLMNGQQDPQIEATAFPPPYVYTVPPWPPPSGGAPFPGSELGPILNPFPYGTTQSANISTGQPSPPGYPPPIGGQPGTFYPTKMPVGANGQNQGPGYQLPVTTKPMEVGPIAAPPSLSAISPPPKMGPGPQGVAPWEVGPVAGNPPPTKTFPAGSYIDGYGNLVTPTGVVRTIGGLGN